MHDITYFPPPDWSVERRMEYFAWAERVVAKLRGVNAKLEARFDDVLAEARRVTSRAVS